MDFTRTSKFMSLILRHRPEAAGLVLDENGYVPVDDLLAALNADGHGVTRALFEQLVAENDRQRFAFDASGTRIRAVQGHSRAVDLEYQPEPPPVLLFHGTVERFLASIRSQGLQARGRQYVHLSGDRETAGAVGRRRGKAVILEIASGEMSAEGRTFYRAPNGIWLTDEVPPEFIRFPI